MKTLLCRINMALSIVLIVSPALAHAAPNQPRAISATPQDSKKAKDELYSKFKKGLDGDANARKASYEAGQEYLQKYPDEKDPRAKEIKEWIATYAPDVQAVEVLVNVYKAKKYAEAFEMGKKVLVTDPDNIRVLTALGYAGMQAAATGDSSFTTDAIGYAKKAIQLITGGKAPIDWKPFGTRDDTLGWLNYSLGVMVLKSSPNESIGYLNKTAQLEGTAKKNPVVYIYLTLLYGQELEKQRTVFKSMYEGKPETPESKAALEKADGVVDLIVDAYARAISYTDASPQLKQTYQQQEADWMTKLTDFYKYRHNGSDAGLKDMIGSIQSKPLPGPQSSLEPLAMP